MRHRIGMAAMTGLGNSSPELLSNTGTLTPDVKAMLDDAIQTFRVMKDRGGLDFDVHEHVIRFGIEPAYQYQDLEIVQFAREKANCFYESGRAWGYYGSDIAKKRKYYFDYKRTSRLQRFVDKWHPVIYGPSE